MKIPRQEAIRRIVNALDECNVDCSFVELHDPSPARQMESHANDLLDEWLINSGKDADGDRVDAGETNMLVRSIYEAEAAEIQEASYGLQAAWFKAHPECEFETTDRTDEIIARWLEGIRARGEILNNAVELAMDEWYAEEKERAAEEAA